MTDHRDSNIIDPRASIAERLDLLGDVYGVLGDYYDQLHALVDSRRPASRQTLLTREIAKAESTARSTLKVSEVQALLYIGDRLDALVKTVDAQRLTADEVDNLIGVKL